MAAVDQDARRCLDCHTRPAKPMSQRELAAAERVRAVDAANTARMKRIVAERGWPGRSLVGDDGAQAAWLLVQHADHDPAFQRACLELLGQAVQAGEADARQHAYLTDRCVLGAVAGRKDLHDPLIGDRGRASRNMPVSTGRGRTPKRRTGRFRTCRSPTAVTVGDCRVPASNGAAGCWTWPKPSETTVHNGSAARRLLILLRLSRPFTKRSGTAVGWESPRISRSLRRWSGLTRVSCPRAVATPGHITH
jgi:hypothetical protein